MMNHLARTRLLAFLLLLACFQRYSITQAEDSKGAIDFSRQIRPILAEHCWSCHGPDEKSRTADLRLDIREIAIAASAIVPNDPKSSKLVDRILSGDSDFQMPPPSSKKPLSDVQKKLLQEWIRQGAGYSKHWAFTVPVSPAIPALNDKHVTSNAIDHLVAKRLEQEQLKPSLRANRSTLLRRVSLDLTGLPPTLDELKRFLDDPSDDAYEQSVDRLLSSKSYAEKMAMEWLDLARYA
ncbi:MAG: DUF1549 domain-containing protein, partial [Pirellula sp.]